MDADLWSKSADSCGRNIWAFVPLWCPPPLRHIALFSHDGWLHRDVQIPVFYPASRPASCVCDHIPIAKNFKFAPRKKTFRPAFHPHESDGPCQCFSLMVSSQSTDRASLKWLRQWYTVYGFRFHGSLWGREIADNTDDIRRQNRFHPCTRCVFRHISCACIVYDRLETGLKHRYQ